MDMAMVSRSMAGTKSVSFTDRSIISLDSNSSSAASSAMLCTTFDRINASRSFGEMTTSSFRIYNGGQLG